MTLSGNDMQSIFALYTLISTSTNNFHLDDVQD